VIVRLNSVLHLTKTSIKVKQRPFCSYCCLEKWGGVCLNMGSSGGLRGGRPGCGGAVGISGGLTSQVSSSESFVGDVN